MARLVDYCSVLRSKNVSASEIGFDFVFKSRDMYHIVKDSNVMTPQLVANLYGIAEDRVTVVRWFEQANALKITVRRNRTSGGPGENDLYGAQQHVPFVDVEIIPD
jgi:hypothetical protein